MSTPIPTKLQSEIVQLPPNGFSFISRLQTGEALSGTPAVTISVYSGVDPNPQAMLSGAATISNGNTVLQKFTGGVPGVIYRVIAGCATNQGQFLEQLGYLVVLADSVVTPGPAYILLPSGQAILLPGGQGITLP